MTFIFFIHCHSAYSKWLYWSLSCFSQCKNFFFFSFRPKSKLIRVFVVIHKVKHLYFTPYIKLSLLRIFLFDDCAFTIPDSCESFLFVMITHFQCWQFFVMQLDEQVCICSCIIICPYIIFIVMNFMDDYPSVIFSLLHVWSFNTKCTTMHCHL